MHPGRSGYLISGPLKIFFRISVLNTVLVLITFFFIKPRTLFFTLFNPKKLAQLLNDHLFNSQESPRLKALSVGFGIFMGIIPIWGSKLVAAIFLAVLFKLNKPCNYCGQYQHSADDTADYLPELPDGRSLAGR